MRWQLDSSIFKQWSKEPIQIPHPPMEGRTESMSILVDRLRVDEIEYYLNLINRLFAKLKCSIKREEGES